MYPLENATRFFAVVGAPYIPESHLDDCCDEARKQTFATAELDQHQPQTTDATAWWPHTCH